MHFAVTYTFSMGDSIRIYIEGVEFPGAWIQGTGCDLPYTGSMPVTIGTVGGVEQQMEGWIDEVRVYNRVLSPSEISNLTGGTPVRFGLVGEWLFD